MPGGTPILKGGGGEGRQKFWIKPLKETNLGVAQPFFDPILVPRARRFLVTWSGNEGLWKQPLPDVRKFLTSGRACAEVTNITAHSHNGFLSLTAPLGKKFYFLSSLQRVASLDVLKMHHFAQLGFTDNLELKKKTVTETGWTHCWFAELRQLICRLSSELYEFFFSVRFIGTRETSPDNQKVRIT